ncbi:hypothetical protein, partial [Nonomuraea indica]|uniref:hypothetical protein n=1 Tax=Nonomuraea indica TaxID=1581193 RepID=UPI0015DF8875
QPGTGTFTSRDTATLTPNPSVQANRYTYANASPLTGIDPTGHYTDHLSRTGGPEYDLSRDHQEIAESYARIGIISGGGGSGLCIGKACARDEIGGGAMGCDAQGCFGVIITSWLRIYTDEEAKRRGLMPNGEPVDQPNFWHAKEKTRNSYLEVWSPGMSDEERAMAWVGAGGLDGWSKYQRAVNIKDIPEEGAPLYRLYSKLVRHAETIEKAAIKHGLSKHALTALLIYETMHLEPNTGWAAKLWGSVQGWEGTTSLGIGQIQIQLARHLLKTYYPEDYRKMGGAKASNEAIGRRLADDDALSIRLAAAYMQELKSKITVTTYTKDGRRTTRHINDWEAAVAYAVDPADFQEWINGGKFDYPKTEQEVKKRWREIHHGDVNAAAREYWRCADRTVKPGQSCARIPVGIRNP